VSRAYYGALYLQLLANRADARVCANSYKCGEACIPLAKHCRKEPDAALGQERLNKIRELAAGDRPEGKGLGRLRQSEAAAKAAELQQQRFKASQERLRARSEEKRQQRQQVEQQQQAAASLPAAVQAHLDAVKAQTVVQPGGGATGEAVAATLGALAARPGREGAIAADVARFIAEAKVAIVFSRDTRRAKDSAFLNEAAPVLRASAEKAAETTGKAIRGVPFNMSHPTYVAHVRRTMVQRSADKQASTTAQIKEKHSYWSMYRQAEGLSWRDGHNVAIRDHGVPLKGDIAAMKARVEDSLQRAKDGRADWNLGTPRQTVTAVSVDLEKPGPATIEAAPSIPQAESTLKTTLHEIGHQVHARATDADGEFTKYSPRPFRGEPAVSSYGATHASEAFAEAFAAYTLAPDKLKELFPKTHAWVEERLAKALEGQTRGK
jgi:hypothetical protein